MLMKIAIVSKEAAVNFGAEELQRCLRQMNDELEISMFSFAHYEESVASALWLMVSEDLENSVVDPVLDDAFSIDVKDGCGKICGSNPRSILFGCYRYLKELGCTWVRPGKDGEFIPKRSIQGTKVLVDEKAAYRHRGICIEGSVSYDHVADMIDWMPKICMNAYFNQFNNPVTFYNRWYEHRSSTYLTGEPLTAREIAGLRDRSVAEMKKRGLLYHTAGHGWTCEPFGIPGEAWEPNEYDIPVESQQCLALVNGKRELWGNVPLNTNLCYSNPYVRQKIADAVTQRCKEGPEIDYVQVWLADGTNNHCECEKCRTMRPADWYVTLLNDIDAKLTEAGIDTKVVFLLYVDLLWEPEKVRLNNPDRFTLMFAPITRTYSASIANADWFDDEDLPPFTLNQLKFPESVGENLAWMRRWRKQFDGDGFDFDYHFMWDHFCDPGYYDMAKTLFADMQSLRTVGLNGMISCQNQRVFLPTGLGMVAMATALWDEKADFESMAKAYFKDAFGNDAETVESYLRTLSQLIDPVYIRGEKPAVNEENATKLAQVPAHLDRYLELICDRIGDSTLPDSMRTSWKYLYHHSQLCRKYALTFQRKAEGKMEEAELLKQELLDFACEKEMDIHHVFDAYEFMVSINRYFSKLW